MSLFLQLPDDLARNARFDQDRAPNRASSRVWDREPWRFESGLDVHTIVHHIRYKLCVRQGLIRTAHDAKTDVNIAALHKSGNDGVKRTLPGRERVRIVFVEDKQGSTIVERETHSLDHDS